MWDWPSAAVPPHPLRMGLEGLFGQSVMVDSVGDHHPLFAAALNQIAQQVRVAQATRSLMKRNPGRMIGNNAA